MLNNKNQDTFEFLKVITPLTMIQLNANVEIELDEMDEIFEFP